MRKILNLQAFMLLAGILSIAGTSQALTISNNFGPGDSFHSGGWIVSSEEDIGVAFTPAGSDYFLDTVELAAECFEGDMSSQLRLSVVEDAGGLPGSSVLESFTLSGLSSTFSIFGLNASGTTLLSADTSYWLVASVEDDSWLGWAMSPAETGVAFKQVDEDWVYFGDTMQTPVFRLSGTPVSPAPVPEPATIFLLGAGMAGLAGARVRKKN